MRALVLVPPFPCASLTRAVELARAVGDGRAPDGLALASGATKADDVLTGFGEVRCIEISGDELPDLHALGLLFASAVDSWRADVVVAPLVVGRPTFEPVAAAVAAQLDWPILTGAERVAREGDDLVVDVIGAGSRRRQWLATPAVLVASTAVATTLATGNPGTRTVIAPSQLQVPPTRLRPCSEAIGVVVQAKGPSRAAVVTSARALVTRLLATKPGA